MTNVKEKEDQVRGVRVLEGDSFRLKRVIRSILPIGEEVGKYFIENVGTVWSPLDAHLGYFWKSKRSGFFGGTVPCGDPYAIKIGGKERKIYTARVIQQDAIKLAEALSKEFKEMFDVVITSEGLRSIRIDYSRDD